jgi:hypothetical protein
MTDTVPSSEVKDLFQRLLYLCWEDAEDNDLGRSGSGVNIRTWSGVRNLAAIYECPSKNEK